MDAFVRGEISNLSPQSGGGNLYFTLKDNSASVKAVMFKSSAQFLRFGIKNGMDVIVRGSVSLYERDGTYQIYVIDIQPYGLGALYLAYEQLKEKLAGEGLFDQSKKKPLPLMPKTIGVVTSPTGAAIQDVLSVLGRRYPLAKVIIAPVSVQGSLAASSITSAIEKLNKKALCEVIILCRGGGSIEELWSFNEEAVVRAVASSSIPIISAVGHESDITLSDFAADLRAATPFGCGGTGGA